MPIVGPIKQMEKWRIHRLLELGIDFSESAPYQETLLFDDLSPYRGYYSTYFNSVLFVNGVAISKGEAFLSFLEKTKLSPIESVQRIYRRMKMKEFR